MTDSLTGKKRLPGFTGEWEVKRLDDVADIRSGGTPSTNRPEFWDGDILWCTPTDITALKGFKYLSQSDMDALEAKLAKARQVKQGMMQELLTGRIRLV